jgi:hypothetical protein
MMDWTQLRTADQIAAEATAAAVARITAAIDAHVEAQARALGYNSAAHLASYTASTVPGWAAEATAFVAWRDAVWIAAYGLQDDHARAGTLPTPDAAVAALPAWQAPR